MVCKIFFQSLWLRNSPPIWSTVSRRDVHIGEPELKLTYWFLQWTGIGKGPSHIWKFKIKQCEDSFRRILLQRGQVWLATSCVWTHSVFGLGRWTLPQIWTGLANPFRTYLVLSFSEPNRTTWTFGVANNTHVLYGLFRHLFSSFPKTWAGCTWVSGSNSSYQAKRNISHLKSVIFRKENGCFFTCSQEEHVYWWYSGYQCHAIHLLGNISLHTIIL